MSTESRDVVWKSLPATSLYFPLLMLWCFRQFLDLGVRPPPSTARKSLHLSPGHEDGPGRSGEKKEQDRLRGRIANVFFSFLMSDRS